MFEESIEIIKKCFEEYVGTGMYIALYLIAIVYLFIREEDKTRRAFTIWFPFFVSLIIFNPIFNKAVGKILKESTYWRTFWLLPIGITIAYAFTKVVGEVNEKRKKIIVSLGLIGIIAVSGKYMFTEQNYLPVDNIYKLPDDIVWVTQIIGADDAEEKKALTSYYVVPYIRQIDPSIKLGYGRVATGYSPTSIAMLVELGDAEKICKRAKKTNCNYIVLHTANKLYGNMEDFGYEEMAKTQYYTIYKEIPLGGEKE